MTPPERKLFIRNTLLGLVISLSMVVANRMGWIQSLERWFYDVRAQTCQYQQTPPTDQLVHLDIDDSTLQAIGAWPWDRQVLAQVIDELTLANAKVVGLDVVFPEPQKPRYALDDNGMVEGELIRDDRLLADSLDQSHHSLLSVAVEIPVADESKALIQKTATDLIDGDLTLSRDAFEKELKTRPIFKQVKQLAVNVDSLFIRTRKQVLYQRSVALLKDNPQAGFYDARQTILPHLDVELIGGSPLINTLEKEFDRARSMQAIHRYTTPLSNVQQPPVTVEAQLPPISLLSQAGMGAGFVTYLPDSDGVVRSVPMAVYDGQKVIPQLGLMLACAYLGVAPRDLHFTENGVQIPKPDGKVISLPLRQEQVESVNRQVRYLYDVPWFGPVDNWQYMYDPQQMQTRQHLPVIAVYRITSYQQEIATNNQQIDKAISIVLDDDADYKLKLNPDLGKSYREQRPPVTNWQARKAMVAKLKADDFVSAVYQDFVKLKDEDLNETDRFFKSELIKAYRAMDEALTRNEQWEKQIVDARTQLKQAVSGKAVLIGWTGTATIADFVQTSLHHKCPGVVVHGAIFNAILTDSSWIRSPAAVDVAIIIILGLIATVLVARLSPVLALIGCVSIACLYFAINGLVLFDRMSLLVTAASPLMTVGMVWSGCTLNRFIIERTDRARITKRFSSYVDPALVNYVINNPDTARLDGELKEMTVVFTDLAGFTTLSEKLRERTVPILNEYMGLMVPIIRKYSGYVNKFLGDGMMFFYAAPIDNPNHAVDSVKTALELQHAMVDFNRKLHSQDLPQVSVRIGISTGNMVVGDAGSEDASDYTVLGDSVNLGARLESANKYTGTAILINDTCKRQLGQTFLLRPVGKLQVVGKSESIMTWEPLCLAGDATDRLTQVATLSEPIVDMFAKGLFAACDQAIVEYEKTLGDDKFSAFYHRQCDRHREHPDEFNGCIVLEAK